MALRSFLYALVFCAAGFAFITAARPALVYSVLVDDAWTIYVQDNLSADPRPIAHAAGRNGAAPAISPSGGRVAFEVQGRNISVCPLDRKADCEVIGPEGGSAVRPAWNPVTRQLVFVRYVVDASGEDSDIYVTRRGAFPQFAPLITQTGIQDYPDVSPNGRWLAYTSMQSVSLHRSAVQVVQHIWVMDLVAGTARQLLATNAQDIQPDWAPSNREIAFASNRTGQFEIWVVGTDGTALRQLTEGPGAKTWPAWSPDGRSVLFTVARNGRQSLWLIDADGSDPRAFQPFGPDTSIELRDADWR